MLLKILAAFHLDAPASLKRALAIAIGGPVVLLIDPFLLSRGLPPVSDVAIEMFAGLVAVYVFQSGMKSAAIGKAEAVASVNAAAMASLVEPPRAP